MKQEKMARFERGKGQRPDASSQNPFEETNLEATAKRGLSGILSKTRQISSNGNVSAMKAL